MRTLGYDVVVEPGAGESATFDDEAYLEVGARCGSIEDADIVLGVNPPSAPQLDRLKQGATLI